MDEPFCDSSNTKEGPVWTVYTGCNEYKLSGQVEMELRNLGSAVQTTGTKEQIYSLGWQHVYQIRRVRAPAVHGSTRAHTAVFLHGGASTGCHQGSSCPPPPHARTSLAHQQAWAGHTIPLD